MIYIGGCIGPNYQDLASRLSRTSWLPYIYILRKTEKPAALYLKIEIYIYIYILFKSTSHVGICTNVPSSLHL